MTNGDRIRQMADEELADALVMSFDCTLCSVKACGAASEGWGCYEECYAGALEWLKQELSEDVE